MIQKSIYLLLLLIPALNSQAQYSDWKFYGLHGKVKSITTRTYSTAELKNDVWEPNKDSLLLTRTYYFDASGLMDSLLSITTANRHAITLKTEYEETKGKPSALKQSVFGEKEPFVSQIIWLDSLKSKTIFKTESGYRSETTEFYSPNYRSIGSVYKSYQNDSLTMHVETLNFYDEENLLVTALDKNITEKTTEIFKYGHVKFDKLNNPIVTVEYTAEDQFKLLHIRTIEYY